MKFSGDVSQNHRLRKIGKVKGNRDQSKLVARLHSMAGQDKLRGQNHAQGKSHSALCTRHRLSSHPVHMYFHLIPGVVRLEPRTNCDALGPCFFNRWWGEYRKG